MSTRLKFGLVALAALAAIGVGAGATAAQLTAGPGYTGVETKVPTAYAIPAKKPGVACTLGFQNPLAANETLRVWQDGFVAKAKTLGCKVITLDDQLNVDRQVSNMQQLLVRKVKAIVFYPIDPKATVPVLRQAKKAGVPVLAFDATFGSLTATAPYLPYVTSQVWSGRDREAYLQARAVALAKPGAKVGLIGLGAPVPSLKYLNQREAYWAKKFGLTVIGSADNPTDDIAGGEKAANGLLQRYPQIDAVIAYNDPSALGTYTAARGAGRTLTIVGLNGSSDGRAGVRSGRLAATVKIDVVGVGVQQALAAYDLVTHQHLPLPKIVVRTPILITRENLARVPTWKTEIDTIK